MKSHISTESAPESCLRSNDAPNKDSIEVNIPN